jgi:hypothetical protein
MTYLIEVLDTDGYELSHYEEETIKEAKRRARYYFSDAYARAIEAYGPVSPVAKVRVSRNGECVFDLYR